MTTTTTAPIAKVSCTTVNNKYARLYYVYLDGKAEDLFGYDCATIEPQHAQWANHAEGIYECRVKGRKALMGLWREKHGIHTGMVVLASDVQAVVKLTTYYSERKQP